MVRKISQNLVLTKIIQMWVLMKLLLVMQILLFMELMAGEVVMITLMANDNVDDKVIEIEKFE